MQAPCIWCNSIQEGITLSIHADAAVSADTGAASAQIARATASAAYDPEMLLEAILSFLSDNKAEDTVQIDLRGKSAMSDYMVVCSGRSTRQVIALCEKLAEALKAEFGLSVRMEGRETGDWVLIDAGDVIVHVFRPEVREFYQIEKMWAAA